MARLNPSAMPLVVQCDRAMSGIPALSSLSKRRKQRKIKELGREFYAKAQTDHERATIKRICLQAWNRIDALS